MGGEIYYPEKRLHEILRSINCTKKKVRDNWWKEWDNWWPSDTWFDGDDRWAEWDQWVGDWDNTWWDGRYDRHEGIREVPEVKDGLLRVILYIERFMGVNKNYTRRLDKKY